MKTDLKVAIGADHAGFDYKNAIIDELEVGEFKDFGTYSASATDYPDFAHPVALAVESGDCKLGILICGSGNGVAMTANKHQGVRAAVCWNDELAILARSHNNANIVCIPARFISINTAIEIVEAFLETDFGGGRHLNRINKIAC